MAKIISFESNNAYNNTLKEVVIRLEETTQVLFDCSVQLAVSGKWKEWSDDQPEDTEFNFDEKMLHDTADKNIDEIMELLEKVVDVKEKLEKNK